MVRAWPSLRGQSLNWVGHITQKKKDPWMQISSSNSLAMDVGVDSNSVGPKRMEAAVDQTEFICF